MRIPSRITFLSEPGLAAVSMNPEADGVVEPIFKAVNRVSIVRIST
jgi:hypothetical protein